MPDSSDGAVSARILIVEDQVIIAEDLCELLTEWGYSVIGLARNVEEAFALLSRDSADLILMDIDFYGRKSGVEATVRIQRGSRVPIVYVSGCTNADLAPTLMMTQPYGFVPKPIDPTYLAAVIRRALRGPGSLGAG